MLKYWEHFEGSISDEFLIDSESLEIFFPKKKQDVLCVRISQNIEKQKHLSLSYFIGVDWLIKNEKAIYVEPKLNEGTKQTNYLEMLFSALKHPEISSFTDDLFDIKWDQPQIEIQQHQDHLTPILVVQFLKIVQNIVRKGLKKSFYKVEENLNSRVKGKILVSKTIKQNLVKNKPLQTFCSFDEFGINNLENRLLKKALIFVRRYMPTLRIPQSKEYIDNVFNYVMPAFEFISEDVSLHDIKHGKYNPFYREYSEGIRMARLILKRFGYNITNTEKEIIKTPPFWIDMSKLFELYVLGLLKDRFGSSVIYHFNSNFQELDYLINSQEYKMVVDAKYKTKYKETYDKEDIRQVSGYARMKNVYEKLQYDSEKLIDCLIIYPDSEKGLESLKQVDLKKDTISQFEKFYKVGVELPLINQH